MTIDIAVWPVVSQSGESRITQEFKPGRHVGVDIAVPGALTSAHAAVVACADGRVAKVYQAPNGGAVLLSHGSWTSAYLHMTDVLVRLGEVVAAGDRIGTMGADPTDPEGVVHLHFQVAESGQGAVDPAPYLEGLTQT